jgi:hypothetical protein
VAQAASASSEALVASLGAQLAAATEAHARAAGELEAAAKQLTDLQSQVCGCRGDSMHGHGEKQELNAAQEENIPAATRQHTCGFVVASGLGCLAAAAPPQTAALAWALPPPA